MPDFAVDFRMSAGLLHEPIDLRQAEAGALAGALGGEERVERLGQHVLGHANSGIADEQSDILARLKVGIRGSIGIIEKAIRRLDGELSAIGHRIARVEGQVDDRILELIGVDEAGPQAPGLHRFDLDRLAQRALQQIRQPDEQIVQIGRARRQRLLP